MDSTTNYCPPPPTDLKYVTLHNLISFLQILWNSQHQNVRQIYICTMSIQKSISISQLNKPWCKHNESGSYYEGFWEIVIRSAPAVLNVIPNQKLSGPNVCCLLSDQMVTGLNTTQTWSKDHLIVREYQAQVLSR